MAQRQGIDRERGWEAYRWGLEERADPVEAIGGEDPRATGRPCRDSRRMACKQSVVTDRVHHHG